MDLGSDNSDARAGGGFKDFFKYLKTVGGALPTCLAFAFPLANNFLKIIPVYGEDLQHISLASLFSAFTILVIYFLRIEIAFANYKFKLAISIILFISGLVAFFSYRTLIFQNPLPNFGQRELALLGYSLIFALWTSSWTLFLMSEYIHANPKLIIAYLRREDVIGRMSKMTPKTRNKVSQGLWEIMMEEEKHT